MPYTMWSVCTYCERRYVNYNDWCELLDMDFILCHESGLPQEKNITECIGCELAAWEEDTDLEYIDDLFIMDGDGEDEYEWKECTDGHESSNCGEHESNLSELLIQSRYDRWRDGDFFPW